MYKYKLPEPTTLKVNKSYVAETIEQKVYRITNNKEPIKDGAPLIYTDRKDGVKPEYDIRTDRFEIAVEAMSHVDKSHKAKREERIKSMGEQAKEGMDIEQKKDGEPKSTQDTKPGNNQGDSK